MVKVRIDRVVFDAPTRKDHLMKVPRKALFLSRNDEGRYFDESEMVHKVRHSGIVCDSCSDPIPYPYVWVLVLCNPMRACGTLCENCKSRYWSEKPAYVMKEG